MEKNNSTPKKILKYVIAVLAIGLLAYKSVYFKKLSTVKAASPTDQFDAAGFSKKLWEEKLPTKIDSAVALPELVSLLRSDSKQAFSSYSNALAIGNIRYFLVKLTGIAEEINEDDITLQVRQGDSTLHIKLATEFIYGNAIRDASGLVDVKDFTNTANLNSISEELNKIIRQKILPPFKAAIKKGSTVQVVGAMEMNKEHINVNEIELIPARLSIIQ